MERITESKPFMLAIAVLGLTLWLKMDWLSYWIGLGLMLMYLSTIKFTSPAPIPQAAPLNKEEKEEYVNRIIKSVDRLNNMITRVLDISAIESQKLILK